MNGIKNEQVRFQNLITEDSFNKRPQSYGKYSFTVLMVLKNEVGEINERGDDRKIMRMRRIDHDRPLI